MGLQGDIALAPFTARTLHCTALASPKILRNPSRPGDTAMVSSIGIPNTAKRGSAGWRSSAASNSTFA